MIINNSVDLGLCGEFIFTAWSFSQQGCLHSEVVVTVRSLQRGCLQQVLLDLILMTARLHNVLDANAMLPLQALLDSIQTLNWKD